MQYGVENPFVQEIHDFLLFCIFPAFIFHVAKVSIAMPYSM